MNINLPEKVRTMVKNKGDKKIQLLAVFETNLRNLITLKSWTHFFFKLFERPWNTHNMWDDFAHASVVLMTFTTC